MQINVDGDGVLRKMAAAAVQYGCSVTMMVRQRRMSNVNGNVTTSVGGGVDVMLLLERRCACGN